MGREIQLELTKCKLVRLTREEGVPLLLEGPGRLPPSCQSDPKSFSEGLLSPLRLFDRGCPGPDLPEAAVCYARSLMGPVKTGWHPPACVRPVHGLVPAYFWVHEVPK
jgi:hypothetical protein